MGVLALVAVVLAGCRFDPDAASSDDAVAGDPRADAGPDVDAWSYVEDFEGYQNGDEPPGWVDTAADNSQDVDDSLFTAIDLGGNMVFGTRSRLPNVHSHYVDDALRGAPAYEYSGRFRFTAESPSLLGAGVTFFSNYPGADEYHRVRSRDPDFELRATSHPDGYPLDGDLAAAGYDANVDVWHHFRVQVESRDDATVIRARVWREGDPEPEAWSIDARDTGPDRYRGGVFGVWPGENSAAYWDDLAVRLL